MKKYNPSIMNFVSAFIKYIDATASDKHDNIG
jgi:hypothetical protein